MNDAAHPGNDPLSRYRRDGERLCVELHLRTTRQLFDARDPSPFRERDLDDDAVEYLVEAVEEIPVKTPVVFVVHFSEEPSPPPITAEAVAGAIRTHMRYEIGRQRRALRTLVRSATLGATLALAILTAVLSASGALERLGTGTIARMTREGLVILGWVALWRPLEMVLYDWWPLRARRRLFERIERADIEVRFG